MNNKELNRLLSEYRNQKVSDFHLKKWKSAVQKELKASSGKSQNQFWIQIIAASIAGFILGAYMFKVPLPEGQSQSFAINGGENATVEYVLIKSY